MSPNARCHLSGVNARLNGPAISSLRTRLVNSPTFIPLFLAPVHPTYRKPNTARNARSGPRASFGQKRSFRQVSLSASPLAVPLAWLNRRGESVGRKTARSGMPPGLMDLGGLAHSAIRIPSRAGFGPNSKLPALRCRTITNGDGFGRDMYSTLNCTQPSDDLAQSVHPRSAADITEPNV